MILPASAHLSEDDPSLLAAFRQLGRIVLDDQPLEATLSAVAQIAKALTGAATELSITLVHERAAATAAFTCQLAADLDERQQEQGHGPCLHAAAVNETVVIQDMATDPRWPAFAAKALAAGVQSSLSIPLQVGDKVAGSVNLYAETAGAFDDREVELAQAFASYAAVALGNAQALERSQTLSTQLRQAIESRAAIEQAKGILMGQRRCSPDDAFDILRDMSQHSNRKLRDVAEALVAAADLTTPPPAAAALPTG